MGPFSKNHDGMTGFLKKLGVDRSLSRAFVARNFLLDEGVTAERYGSYDQCGAVADHGSYEAWKVAHNAYLTRRVFCPGSGTGPPGRLDPNDVDTCPETFRKIDPASPFQRTDVQLDLLRVERTGFIAEKSGEPADRIRQLAESVVDGSARPGDGVYQTLTDILDTWSFDIELRPVYAVFWQDLRDLFEPNDATDWADQLRDRLGLVHLNPAARTCASIDVIVFRYPVADVPKMRGLSDTSDSRPLVPPTVLDGNHSPAFCPAPPGDLTGYTIDLAMDSPPMRQEVLHPTVAFSPAHVWRVGEISRTIDESRLSEAREWHLLAVREHTGRDDYATDTDADLLGE